MSERSPRLTSASAVPVPLSAPLLILVIVTLALALVLAINFGSVLRGLSGFASESKNQLTTAWLMLKKSKEVGASFLWDIFVLSGLPLLIALALALMLGSYLGLLFNGVTVVFIRNSASLSNTSTLSVLTLGQILGAVAAVWFGFAGSGSAYKLASALFAGFFTRLFWRINCNAVFVQLLAHVDANWGTGFLIFYFGIPHEYLLWGPEYFAPLRDLARYVFTQTPQSLARRPVKFRNLLKKNSARDEASLETDSDFDF